MPDEETLMDLLAKELNLPRSRAVVMAVKSALRQLGWPIPREGYEGDERFMRLETLTRKGAAVSGKIG